MVLGPDPLSGVCVKEGNTLTSHDSLGSEENRLKVEHNEGKAV